MNMNNENVNNMNQIDVEMNNSTNTINKNDTPNTKSNKLERLFSQVNGGNFRF